MKSMTGFGTASGLLKNQKISLEIASINSKRGIDLYINVHRDYYFLEGSIRKFVQDQFTRGRVTVTVQIGNDKTNETPLLKIDQKALRQYQNEFKKAGKAIAHQDEVSLEFLIRLPGVLVDTSKINKEEDISRLVHQLLKKALQDFQKSREREGKFLCRDLSAKFKALEKTVDKLEKKKDVVLKAYQKRLLKRVEDSGLTLEVDDERLLKEVVIFSDRSDISEEITRLQSHFKEAIRLLNLKKPIGRNLDFLLQEIGREVNTVGSKANNLEISKYVVELKTELEKIREQVQNIE